MHHNAHRLLILRNARKQHEKHGHVEIELAPRLHPCTNKNGNSSNGRQTNNKNGSSSSSSSSSSSNSNNINLNNK